MILFIPDNQGATEELGLDWLNTKLLLADHEIYLLVLHIGNGNQCKV